jgi:hypothetical protein
VQHQPIPAGRPGFISRTAASLVFLAAGLTAAAADTPARKTVVAGDYHANGFHRFFLGNEYRVAWGTPVSVEVLDLGTEAGGLTPARRVGGQQTKGLALTGADGRSYTFRGLEKDASHLLDVVDPSLKDSVFAKLLNDQMAAQHPASELIARGVLEAVGIPVPAWRLVVLPDDPALGQFRKDFAGAVGVFAVYPQPAKGTVPGFANATEIIDHTALYKKLEAGEGDTADTQALLKARLVDIFMGDWDRHRKQWRWARIPGNPSWVPIPEDRDQAFSRYEGVALASGRGRDPRFQKFGPKYPNIGGLTFNGSEQDRRLLVGFTTEDFVRTAKELQGQLTDAAIEKAVRTMPPEWYAVDGPRLVAEMKARRDALPDIATKYHHHLGRDVDVYLTNQSERVEAKRLGNGDMDVTVRMADKDAAAPPTFHRVFDGHETSDVRVYGLGGNDTVVVTGGSRGPHVRLIGGAGNDTLDATGADNAKLSDTQGQNRAWTRGNDDHEYTPPPPPKNAPLDPASRLDARELGCALGDLRRRHRGLPRLRHLHPEIRLPQDSVLDVAPGAGGLVVPPGERPGRLRRRVPPREPRDSFFGVYAYASGVEVLRFYGFGNETTAPEDQDFNKVNANQFVLYPSFKVRFAGKGLLTLGPGLKYTESDEGADQFINTAKPYGVGKFGEVAVHGILSWDGRDNHRLSAERPVRGRTRLVLSADLGRDERLRPGERQRERLSLRGQGRDLRLPCRGQEGVRGVSLHGGGRHRRGRAGRGVEHPR